MTDFLLFLQSFSTPLLDNIFLFISSLTGEIVYIAVVCAIYWCVNKNKGIIAAITLVFSFSLNTVLKNIFAVPRPYTYSAVRQIDTSTGYGYSFPSGHAQLSTTFAGLGMINIRKKAIYIIGILLIILTGISRMYLGVHTPLDIAVGYILGTAVIFISNILFNHEEHKTAAAIVLFIINVIIFIFIKDKDLTSITFLFAGCITGLLLEERFIRFDVSGSCKAKIGRYIMGMIALFAVKYISGFLGKRISYVFVGFTITFLVPALSAFVKNRLKKGGDCRA